MMAVFGFAGALLTVKTVADNNTSIVESVVVAGAFLTERLKGLSRVRGNSQARF